MFVGRERELAVLETAWTKAASAFIPIYGRRRVGKSELIAHFMRDKRGVQFVGKTAASELQLREFAGEAARVLDEPLLAEMSARGWQALLEAITERWTGDEKLVLAFDEFQWTCEASPELPSVLQQLWDRKWKKSGRVMLILCGSFIGFMEREVLGKESPLFGRRTAQILLRPFNHLEAAQMHPRWSIADRAKAYFICGGIPPYLQCFESSRSIDANITHTMFDEFSPLFREPDFLLREELRDVASYHAILMAMAAGNDANNDIAKFACVPERSLHYYIEQLVSLGYVQRRYPLSSKKNEKHRVRYRIEDPLLRFWFRFVFPHTSFIQHAGAVRAFRERVRPELESYFGTCFERLCREALPMFYAREGVHAPFRVGEYWDTSTQIDVVGLRDDNWTDLGECKWGAVRSSRSLSDEIEAKVRAFPNTRGATIGRRLFVRQAPKSLHATMGDVVVHTLADLYELEDVLDG